MHDRDGMSTNRGRGENSRTVTVVVVPEALVEPVTSAVFYEVMTVVVALVAVGALA